MDLENLGVRKMNAQELVTTDGGVWWRAVVAIIAAVDQLHDLLCDSDEGHGLTSEQSADYYRHRAM